MTSNDAQLIGNALLASLAMNALFLALVMIIYIKSRGKR